MEKQISWVENKEKELEKKVLAEYSSDEVRKHLEYLTTLIRRAGTDDELKAAKYIKSKLEEYGVDGEIYEFDAYISYPGTSKLEILSPVRNFLPCNSRGFIPATPPEGIEAELVYLSGRELAEDYQGVDVRGKIVLVEPAKEGHVETGGMVEEKGVLAQIHITIGKGKSRVINMRQIRYTWGNPTPDTMDKIPKIPCISISNEDGKYLTELIKKDRVWVKLKSDASWRGYKKIRVPMGTLKGMKEPEKFVLLGGHYCSWFAGATDNAATNSLLLEMARIFSKYRKHLLRGIKFAWWSGHEQGTYAGSTWYLDNFWDDVRDNGVAYFVMDGIGRINSSGFEPKNTGEIRKFHERVIKEVLGLEVKSKRVTKSGDQSFWGVGLPSVTGRTAFTAEQTAAFDGEPIWYSHTSEDTLDKLDMELITIPFKVNAVSTLRLCNNPVLPFEFVTIAEIFKKRLDDLQKEFKSILPLNSLITQVETLEKKTVALNNSIKKNLLALKRKGKDTGFKNKFREINRCLMELSRILIPVLLSKAGKYGQDPIQSKFKPIPILQPLEKLTLMNRDGEEYKALITALVRERNKVSDALNLANRILDNTLEKI